MTPQMSPIQRGLEDRHPYVRRTAVMGVLKVYNFDAGAVRNAGARCAKPNPGRRIKGPEAAELGDQKLSMTRCSHSFVDGVLPFKGCGLIWAQLFSCPQQSSCGIYI